MSHTAAAHSTVRRDERKALSEQKYREHFPTGSLEMFRILNGLRNHRSVVNIPGGSGH